MSIKHPINHYEIDMTATFCNHHVMRLLCVIFKYKRGGGVNSLRG